MQSRKDGQNWIIALAEGEEIVSTLNSFFAEKNIKGGFLFGLGAVKNVELMAYDIPAKKYDTRVFNDGNYELANLTASVTETGLHAHATISDAKCNAFGGHLGKATVAAAFEAILIPSSEIKRKPNEKLGLKLFKL